MVRPLPPEYVQPDEEILLEARRHKLSIVDGLIGLLFGWLLLCAAAGAAVWFLAPQDEFWQWSSFAWAPLTLGALLLALMLHWRRATSLYVVTPQRVYQAHGRFRFHLGVTTYDKVTDMQVYQSFWGRIFGFGTVTVETAGSGLSLMGVDEPFKLKHRLEKARDEFVRALIAREAPRADVTRRTGEDDDTDVSAAPIWQSGPAPASLLGPLLTIGIITLFVLPTVGITTVLALGTLGILIAVAVAVVLAMSVAGVIIQYRFTVFSVHRDGVVVRRGWLSRRRVETTYSKVTDVTTAQDILGRIFNYGTITINTAGGTTAPVVFGGVRDPEAVKHVIDEARRARR